MKTKCLKCGKEFEDEYKDVNEYNVRIYCNDCIDNERRRMSHCKKCGGRMELRPNQKVMRCFMCGNEEKYVYQDIPEGKFTDVERMLHNDIKS